MSATGVDARLVDAVRATTGWDEARGWRAVREYERFVTLWRARPEVPLVPCADVDEVWHAALARPGTDVPPHDVRDDPRRPARFAHTRRLYTERWGEPDPVWDVAGPCQTDAPYPDPVAPEDPPPEPVLGQR